VVAEAEGSRLHLSSNSSTGYRGVQMASTGRFQARHSVDGKDVSLGYFDTAVEAAVAYARVAGEAPTVAAEAEGLRLHLLSSNVNGYKGVCKQVTGRFQARRRVDGRQPHLGYYGSAMEAVGQVAAAGAAGPSAAAAGEASDSDEGELGGAGGEAAAAESSSDEEEEAASPPLRAPSCNKTLGCSLRLWHDGACSTAVTGRRARVLTDKVREAKRGKGGEGWRGGGGGSGGSVLPSSSSEAALSPPNAEAPSDGDEVEVEVEQEEAEEEAMSEDDVEEVAPPLQSSAAAAPSLAGGDVQISAASGAAKPPPS